MRKTAARRKMLAPMVAPAIIPRFCKAERLSSSSLLWELVEDVGDAVLGLVDVVDSEVEDVVIDDDNDEEVFDVVEDLLDVLVLVDVGTAEETMPMIDGVAAMNWAAVLLQQTSSFCPVRPPMVLL